MGLMHDGMGDNSVFSECRDIFLPDKALRFAFAVLKCSAKIAANGERKCFTLFNPRSLEEKIVTRTLEEGRGESVGSPPPLLSTQIIRF